MLNKSEVSKDNRKTLLVYPEIQIPLIYTGITLILSTVVINFFALMIFIYKYRFGDVPFIWSQFQDTVFNIFRIHYDLLIIFVIAMALVALLFYRYFSKLSNKFAGPLYKIEKELETICTSGKFKPIEIRSTDYLGSFVGKLNRAFQTTQK